MAFDSYGAARHAIGRANDLLDASKSTSLTLTVRGDMRRLGVVMAVAALDTYMHRLIVERVYEHEELPGGLARLDISFATLLAQADEAGRRARRNPHNSRPRVSVKRELRDRLLRETFQRQQDVSRALGMAGRSGNWDAISQRLTPPRSSADVRNRLNRIVDRRNQVVHEGDYQRLERPRGPRRNGMSYNDARGDINFLADLIDAIHATV